MHPCGLGDQRHYLQTAPSASNVMLYRLATPQIPVEFAASPPNVRVRFALVASVLSQPPLCDGGRSLTPILTPCDQ